MYKLNGFILSVTIVSLLDFNNTGLGMPKVHSPVRWALSLARLVFLSKLVPSQARSPPGPCRALFCMEWWCVVGETSCWCKWSDEEEWRGWVGVVRWWRVCWWCKAESFSSSECMCQWRQCCLAVVNDAVSHVWCHINSCSLRWALSLCMAMPSVMATCWVGQNSDAVFRRMWTKVHQIKFACAGVSVVCNVVFRLTISCCVPQKFAIKSRSCAKSRQDLMFWGLQISGG